MPDLIMWMLTQVDRVVIWLPLKQVAATAAACLPQRNDYTAQTVDLPSKTPSGVYFSTGSDTGIDGCIVYC